MEAIVLGSGPGLPQVDRNLSSVLVRHQGQLILADCGDGCIRRLMDHGIGADDLAAVIITHYHPDHVGGMFMLLQMLYLMGRVKPLPVFMPERPQAFIAIMQLMYTFSQKFAFDLQILEMEQLSRQLNWIEAVPSDHLHGYKGIVNELGLSNELKSWSLCFYGENGKLVYTSDLGSTDSIAGTLKHAHTAIVDAGHPAADQILQLKDWEIKRVILTHGRSAELTAKAHLLDPMIYEYAEEDIVYKV